MKGLASKIPVYLERNSPTGCSTPWTGTGPTKSNGRNLGDAALDSAMEALERQKMEGYVRDISSESMWSGDGAISVAEAVKACRNDDDFAEAMGFDGRVKIREGWSKEQLIESLAEMDTDGDCSISWDEFRKALLGPWGRATNLRYRRTPT